jgi:hypothetical protein
MHRFLEEGSQDNMHRIQIARCIRPSLEGLFRIKFHKHIKQNDWLGNFIEYIRDSDIDSPFKRLSSILEQLENVNDYSRTFHHSNSPYVEEQISEGELKSFVRFTLDLIDKI